MEETTLIKGGIVVDVQDVSQKDILIRGDRIAEIGEVSLSRADFILNVEGCLIFPGAIDTHVHFNDSFMNTISVHDFYSGTRAAAFGGVTSIIDFANQASDGSLHEAVESKKREAEGNALVDWGIHPVITRPDPPTIAEIPSMIQTGVPTIKCYMTYREEGLMVDDFGLREILISLKRAGGMLLVHAEDNDLIERNIRRMIEKGFLSPIYHARSRPPETERLAIARCINLAQETGGRLFIVHMASDRGVEEVGRARSQGVDIFAETCTHYLVLTDEVLERSDGIKWICSPPLRNGIVQHRLWEGISDGRISMVTSDDAAFSWESKKIGADRFDRCPNGIPGVETRLPLLYSEGVGKGRITLGQLVDLIAATPAKLFGLSPRKGRIQSGADADLVVFDPEESWIMGQKTSHMAADWSAYEGFEVTGRVKKVISRGELIIDGESCLAHKGRGKFLHRTLEMEG
ncbi:dihydropyrimidinase [Acidobacteriota bacterium]